LRGRAGVCRSSRALRRRAFAKGFACHNVWPASRVRARARGALGSVVGRAVVEFGGGLRVARANAQGRGGIVEGSSPSGHRRWWARARVGEGVGSRVYPRRGSQRERQWRYNRPMVPRAPLRGLASRPSRPPRARHAPACAPPKRRRFGREIAWSLQAPHRGWQSGNGRDFLL